MGGGDASVADARRRARRVASADEPRPRVEEDAVSPANDASGESCRVMIRRPHLNHHPPRESHRSAVPSRERIGAGASAAQRAAPAGRGDRGPLTARRSSSRTLPRRALASSRAFVLARAGVAAAPAFARESGRVARGTPPPVRRISVAMDLSALETLDNAEKQDKGPSPSPHPARHDPSPPPPRARALTR